MLIRMMGCWVCLQLFYILVLIVSRQCFELPIVFYSSLILIPISCGLLGVILYITSRSNRTFRVWLHKFQTLEILIPSILLYVFSSYSFVITVPTLLDRSISYYILGTVYQSGDEGVTHDEIESHFIYGFVKRNGAIAKRLDEQLVTGNISKNAQGFYTTTPRGKNVYKLTLFLSHLFNVDDRYIIAAGLDDTREMIRRR